MAPVANLESSRPRSTAVVGLQWGDEGKGKLVDLLAAEHDAVVRYNGGANAGHSVVVKGERYKLHLVPAGVMHAGKLSIIGNGVVVDPGALLTEIDGLRSRGVDCSGIVVSDRAHVVVAYHKAEDRFREEALAGTGRSAELGTTKRGIGPCYADKVQRSAAIRVGDLLRPAALRDRLERACAFKNGVFRAASGHAEEFDPGALAVQLEGFGGKLEPMIRDTTYLLHELLGQGKRMLFEGANATLLDVDHGTYPYVTSSSCSVLGIGPGTGVPPSKIGRVLGVVKAYSTRVGKGPMPTELIDATGDTIRERGNEYGTTTGRPRRVGWLDLVAVKYAAMVNGATGLGITLLDVLGGFAELRVCTAYRLGGKETDRFPADAGELAGAEPVYRAFGGFPDALPGARKGADLPDAARRYLAFIEEFVGVPIDLVSVGPDREQTIVLG